MCGKNKDGDKSDQMEYKCYDNIEIIQLTKILQERWEKVENKITLLIAYKS